MPTLISEDKFESGGTWTGSAGSPTIVTTPVPVSSTRALKLNAIGEYVYWSIPASGYQRVVFGAWVRWAGLPTTLKTRALEIDFSPTEGWLSQPASGSGEPELNADGSPTMSPVVLGSNLAINTWHWVQLMAENSANPWRLRCKIGATTIETTGAATASNLNGGLFLLGNTTGGDALTVYYGHAKMGVAANDTDWWTEPVAPSGLVRGSMLTGVG